MLQSVLSFLAQLFSEKNRGFAIALALPGASLSSACKNFDNLKYLYYYLVYLLKTWEYVFTIQRAIHTIKGDNSKCILFQNDAPFWTSTFYPLLAHYHTVPTFNNRCERGLLKRFYEKEKMLVTSIFSFSRNVFNPF